MTNLANIKVIYFLLGRALFAITITFAIPIIYAVELQRIDLVIPFAFLMSLTLVVGAIFTYAGRGHNRRVQVIESAIVMIVIWILLAVFGAIPFIFTQWLSPVDAILETVSDLTAASVSFLPKTAPYILRIWQSTLMWLGSFIFLSILVTILPEVSGCFGLELSLSQGQIFSPMIGQMREMAKKILIIYEFLTFVSFIMFKLAGLNNWDAVLMAMRCISTGGGDYFPYKYSLYVEYAAMFSMLIACGNFLLYFRLFYTLVPPASSLHLNKKVKLLDFAKHIRHLLIEFLVLLRRNILSNCKIFFSNSEVKFLLMTILGGTLLIFFSVFSKNYIVDGNESFRIAMFHVISYMSTTGVDTVDITKVPDFNRYFLFLMVIIGGCMGSVTGGLKIIRIIVLFKLAAIEVTKTLHPRMITNIKVNGVSVPMKVVGRILTFFFMCTVTLFIFSVILSLSGQPFSKSVAMSLACMTNVGTLPGICETADFMALPAIMKLFCCIILIAGRMEIFAFFILISYVHLRNDSHKW